MLPISWKNLWLIVVLAKFLGFRKETMYKYLALKNTFWNLFHLFFKVDNKKDTIMCTIENSYDANFFLKFF